MTSVSSEIEKYAANHPHYYGVELSDIFLKYLMARSWRTFCDVGCGDGALLEALNRKGIFKNKNVIAVDASSSRLASVEGIHPSFRCVRADACSMTDIADRSVDFLAASQVIEHVESDEAMLAEIKRVLHPEGTVYLSTVFKKPYGWYFYRCRGRWVLDPTHVREYTQEATLLSLFKKLGLVVHESRKILFRFPFTDFFFKRLGIHQKGIYGNPILRTLRRAAMPIPGYYNWEMILFHESRR